MARYIVHVRTERSPQQAFEYMADMENFAAWDPGVIDVTQAGGDGAGLGAAYDVAVRGIARPLVLRYNTIEYDAPHSVVVQADSRLLTSLDRISIEPDGDGSIVTYDAELTLNGLLALADPILKLLFGRIGDRAAEGLVDVLDGQRIPEPA